MRPARTFVGAGVLVAVLTACGDDGGRSSTADETTSSGGPVLTTVTTPRDGECVSGATETPRMASGPTEIALLTAVRTGRQPCADRVVFDFDAAASPGYTIRYEPGPFTLGQSDLPVSVAGDAFLVVRFDRSSGVDLSQPALPPTYTGPESIVPSGLTHVRELRRIEDFEAQLVWVLGIDGGRPFTVGTLTGATRVYLDVADR